MGLVIGLRGSASMRVTPDKTAEAWGSGDVSVFGTPSLVALLEMAARRGAYFMVQPRLEYAPIFGRARVKLSDAFWQKSGTAGLRGVVEMALASAKDRDGAYAFQIFGTLGHPQARPAAQ